MMTTDLHASGRDDTDHGHRHLGAALAVISIAQLMVVLDSKAATQQVAFVDGSTHAFIVGAFMIWAGALLVFLFMNVKHEEINDTGAPVVAGVA